jgi:outer membrane murein-binding lipoprotein Lpp
VISSLTALLVIFAAVIGSTAMMGLVGYFLHRIRQVEARISSEESPQQLVAHVDAMRGELLAVQEEMSALSERLDFTERLLTGGDDAGGGDAGVSGDAEA